jgi:DNA polymerase IV
MVADDSDPSILHVDMDAFYAAVEVLDDPSLAGKAVIVGGSGNRGVVAACSYEARVFGVRSAMPSAQAHRLCPDAVWLHGRYDRYAEVSRELHRLFADVTPRVEGIALDEAFLDARGARRLLGDGRTIGWALRERIRDELGLTASVGVAAVKMLAKLASEAAKPTVTAQGFVPGPGVFVIEPGTEIDFLHPLPVRALWGVGPATEKRLARYGVQTVGDLAALPVDTVERSLGSTVGRHLHELAWARDPRPVVPEPDVKSIGHEETYAHDLVDEVQIHREAMRLSDAVATRMKRAGLAARTVTVKVRYPDFRTLTRSHTLPEATDISALVTEVARALLDGVDLSPGVRLLGVSCSGLGEPPAHQLTIDDVASEGGRRSEIDRAVEEVRRRFGDRSIASASIGPDRVKRQGDTQWGPRGPSSKEGG